VSAPADSYRPQLDGLRALAIGAVFVEHWTPWGSAIREALPWGSLGVRLFFVLSGFLITDILLRARFRAEALGAPLLRVVRQFVIRRALRIFPALSAVALALAAADFGDSRAMLPWTLTYTSNLYCAWIGTWPVGIAHFWSLGVEEQFYLAWPWLILFAPAARLSSLVAGIVVAAPLARLIGVLAGANQVTVMVLPSSCLDTLGIGACLALMGHGLAPAGLSRFMGRPAALVGTALAATVWGLRGDPGSASHQAMVVLLDVGLALAFGPLVRGACDGFAGLPGRLLAVGPVAYLGRISYGLYLVHVVPSHAAASLGLGGLGPGALFVACFAITVAAASLSWHLFEQPINALKSRFPYVESAPR
jgi:peptidoglycan/LPS O-acetylase OafA/YrhL